MKNSFCVFYQNKKEHDYESTQFCIDAIWMQDGTPYAEACFHGISCGLKLYLLDERHFAAKGIDDEFPLKNGCLTLFGVTGKQLEAYKTEIS